MANHAIPAHPGAAAAQAAAQATGRPVPTHQPNRAIPTHPGVVAAQMGSAARAVPAPVGAPSPVNPQVDDWLGGGEAPAGNKEFYSQTDLVEDTPDVITPPVQAPQVQAPQQAPADLSDIDDLLRDIPQEQPVVPQPQQEQQPQAVQVPVAQAPAAAEPAYDPAAAQKKAIDELMGREYAIDDVQARRLISEPETVLPEIAARVHVNVLREVGTQIGRVIPALVDQLVQKQLGAQRAEMEFFGRYPKLAHPQFRPFVEKALMTYRGLHPNADRETAMREGATLAAYMIRSQYQNAAARQSPAPIQRAPVQPYTPVAPGAGGAPLPTRPDDGNPFALLAADPDLFQW